MACLVSAGYLNTSTFISEKIKTEFAQWRLFPLYKFVNEIHYFFTNWPLINTKCDFEAKYAYLVGTLVTLLQKSCKIRAQKNISIITDLAKINQTQYIVDIP